MPTGLEILHPGLSPYHHLKLIVPFLAAVSPMFLARFARNVNAPQPAKALMCGLLVGCVAYIILKFFPVLSDKHETLGKSVVMGLLVAEFMVFSVSDKIPSVPSILFFLFAYFFALAKMSRADEGLH